MLLEEIESPVIMETHGGIGVLFNKCYREVEHGIVFEKDAEKVVKLAKQRPNWSIYETDCNKAIVGGVGAHLAINYFDLDPYGIPWETVELIFDHWRYFPSKFAIALTDGGRNNIRYKRAWINTRLKAYVALYGNEKIYDNYKEIHEDIFESQVAARGFKITKWTAYYCGHFQEITHYGAILEREQSF